MPINSNQKGKRVERAAAAYLRGLGFDARRGQQYSGGEDSPDVVCEALSSIHIEVKGDESLADHTALMDRYWDQAKRDAGGKTPVVLWKLSRRPWRLTYIDGFGVRVTTTRDDRIKRVLLKLSEKGAPHGR